MEYPKIHSLYKRDPETHAFIDEYAKPEFASCSHRPWHIEEKIDGMNMRVYISDGKITDIKGRTDAASVPSKLLQWLQREELAERIATLEISPMILYGEGFGAGIQTGGIYRPDQAMILFDCYAGGKWSSREEVYLIAQSLGMEVPMTIGNMTMNEAIEYVKTNPKGLYRNGGYPMEGIICRSDPLVRFNDRSANPVMFKLKCKDFK